MDRQTDKQDGCDYSRLYRGFFVCIAIVFSPVEQKKTVSKVNPPSNFRRWRQDILFVEEKGRHKAILFIQIG